MIKKIIKEQDRLVNCKFCDCTQSSMYTNKMYQIYENGNNLYICDKCAEKLKQLLSSNAK